MNDKDEFLDRLRKNYQTARQLPSRANARRLIDEIIEFLFPVRMEAGSYGGSVETRLEQLRLEFLENLLPLAPLLREAPERMVEPFFSELPTIHSQLVQDAETIERFDPAAASVDEVIVAYPGFYAIAVHRLAHRMVKLGIPILPRIISEGAHMQTGIDIHPGASIGDSFFIDHGTGIVIGESTSIGNNVKIYQGVTLGALNIRKDNANMKRHPTIEDNVIIYSGSTILGGKTVIGHDSIIGGNVWLTESVLPYSVVYHKSEVHVRNEKYTNEVADFVI